VRNHDYLTSFHAIGINFSHEAFRESRVFSFAIGIPPACCSCYHFPMQTPYHEVLLTLAKYKVNYILAGGVAAVLHGVERVTMDIDIALEMEEANLQRFISAIDAMMLKPRVPVASDFILNPKNRELLVTEKNALVFTYNHPSNPFFHLDIFLTEALSYPELAKDSEIIELEGVQIRLVSIKKLISLKKCVDTERPKDIHDIMVLTKILQEKSRE